MNNIEDIVNDQYTEKYFNDELEAFKKNKFIEYLPDENCGKLKMDILFDKNGLIDLCNNNMIYFTNNNELFKHIIPSKSKTKNNNEN